MDEQVDRREKIGSTPRMMTNNSSVGTINPVAVADPLVLLKGDPTISEY